MVRVRVGFEKTSTGTGRVRIEIEILVRRRDGYVMIFKSEYGDGTGTGCFWKWYTGTESVPVPVLRGIWSLYVAPHWLTHFFLGVEHKKVNQTTAELPFGCVFGVQLGLRKTTKKDKKKRKVFPTFIRVHLAFNNARVCQMPSSTPKRKLKCHFSMAVFFRFWCYTRLLMLVKNRSFRLKKLWMARNGSRSTPYFFGKNN